MQTKPKANSVITHSLNTEGLHPVITFHVRGAGAITLDMDRLSADVVQRAAIHGMIQRISDAAAISRDEETGLPATPEEKLEAMSRLVAHYESGTSEWSRVAEAGPKGGVLFKALCEMFPDRDAKSIREWLDELSKKEQTALRADPKVKAIIDRMQAEVGKSASVDTSALLAQIQK